MRVCVNLDLLTVIYQPMHTDICADIVGKLTVKSAAFGGAATLASGLTIYNELAKTRPDILRLLAEPDWPFDT